MKKMWSVAAIGAAFVLGFIARGVVPASPWRMRSRARVYELRTYTAPDGKLEELHARFRNHTMRIFQKHGITNVAYFRPQDSPLQGEHADLSDRASEPRGRQAELGRLPQGSRVAEGRAGVAGQREDRRQGRVGVPRRDGLLADEVARGCARRFLRVAVGRGSFTSRHLHRPGPGAGRRVHALRPHGQRSARSPLSDRHLVRHLGLPARPDLHASSCCSPASRSASRPAATGARTRRFSPAVLQAPAPLLAVRPARLRPALPGCSGSSIWPRDARTVAVVSGRGRPAADWRDVHRRADPGDARRGRAACLAGPPFAAAVAMILLTPLFWGVDWTAPAAAVDCRVSLAGGRLAVPVVSVGGLRAARRGARTVVPAVGHRAARLVRQRRALRARARAGHAGLCHRCAAVVAGRRRSVGRRSRIRWRCAWAHRSCCWR